MATTRVQLQYRIRTDSNAADAGAPTWGAALNTTYFPGNDVPFRIRFTCQNTGTTTPAGATQVIRASYNGGAYAAVTTSTSQVKSIDATGGASADNSSIATANFRLGAGSGSAIAGQYDTTGATASFVLTASRYTEFEFGLQINSANVNHGDTLAFRVYSSTTAYNTYTQTPTITIQKAVTGALAVTESADTLSASGGPKVAGALSATEANDTISAAGGPVAGASLSTTEAADTLVSAGGPVAAAGASLTEDDDALSAAGSDTVTGSASIVSDDDTLSAASSVSIAAILAVLEAGDILVSAGTTGATAEFSVLVTHFTRNPALG